MEKRRQDAILLKSKIKIATDEEIQEMENLIPEWKRGAVVLVENENEDLNKSKLSFFEAARSSLKNHITCFTYAIRRFGRVLGLSVIFEIGFAAQQRKIFGNYFGSILFYAFFILERTGT